MSSESLTTRLLSVVSAVLLVAALTWAQEASTPKERDLSPVLTKPQDTMRGDITVLQTRPGEPPDKSSRTKVPRGYALVVGIGQYEKLPADDYLRFSESDAEAMYRVLINPEGGAFLAENVHKLIGNQATMANLQRELEVWLPSVAREQDRVIVYFAGHGFVSRGRGYLAPWDEDPKDPEASAYPMSTLGEVLAKRVNARWKVLFTDACHSGKITPGNSDEAVDEQLRGLPHNFLTLTATRGREKSYEDSKLATGFGVFTYFVVQGLMGQADEPPCDGITTADELVHYVRESVRSYTRERGVSQNPTEYGDFDNDMALGVRSASGCYSNQSVGTGTLVIEANQDQVDVYLDGALVGTLSKDKPVLSLPGLTVGEHTIIGVRKGYEPATKQVTVIPGPPTSVTLQIQYRREYKKSAIDYFDQGMKLMQGTVQWNYLETHPSHQNRNDLLRAQRNFQEALEEDPNYPEAALKLAEVSQVLGDRENELKGFQTALKLDPSYVEALILYAAVLIEDGDPDSAIRNLTDAIRLAPQSAPAHSFIARAYDDKSLWSLSIAEANEALKLDPKNAEAYLWKGDALRRQTAHETNISSDAPSYQEAAGNFRTFITLTNFHTPGKDKFDWFMWGFNAGSKRHADERSSWRAQRSWAFLGLCDCEARLGNSLRAVGYCEEAVKLDSKDPNGYFLLANAYRDLFNSRKTREYLILARQNYKQVVDMNPDIPEAHYSLDYMDQIDHLLPKVR